MPTAAAVSAPERMTVAALTRETADTVTLRLDLRGRAEGFAFSPGQFNMLYAFGRGESAISISGDPERPHQLVHTIRALGTVTQALTRLRPGDSLGVRGPFGSSWPVLEARGHDVVVVAGGLGLAPLRPAILRILHERSEYGRVVILYGARTPEDLLFRRELERWRGRLDVELEVTVDRAGADWRGRVDVVPALLSGRTLDPQRTLAMVCGPEAMMRFTVRALQSLGLSSEHVYVSLERSMRCGVGLCGHCQLLPLFVCKDGPVVRFDRVALFFDRREI